MPASSPPRRSRSALSVGDPGAHASTVYHRSGSSESSSHGSRYRRLRRRSAVSSSRPPDERPDDHGLRRVIVLRRRARPGRYDTHLGEDRPLGAGRDHRLGDPVDPDARPRTGTAFVGAERLDRVDPVRADVLAEPRKTIVRRHAIALRSASATRSWSSRSSRAWNGSAIVRALQSSLTGQHPLREAVPLAHVRLQVDRRQVRRRRDPLVATSCAITRVAVDAGRELHDVHEPRANVVVVVGERRLDVDVARAARRSARRPRRRAVEDAVELLELPDPERRRDVVEAVVVAEPSVLEPARRSRAGPGCAARRAARAARRAGRRPRRPRRSSSACSDRRPRPRGGRASRAACPCTCAPSASQESSISASPCRSQIATQRVELGRVAEDVDRDERLRPRRDRRLDRGRVEVEGVRVDVGEDRRRALVDRAVRRRDERVRRRDHLVARPDAGEAHAEVQPGRARRDRRAVRRADRVGEHRLEPRRRSGRARAGPSAAPRARAPRRARRSTAR